MTLQLYELSHSLCERLRVKMFSKEAALLKQIDESRKAIRQKHLQLKVGLSDVQDEVTKVFKPIVQPLNKMVEKSTALKQQDHSTPIKLKKSLFMTVDDHKDDYEQEESDISEKSELESQFYNTGKNISPPALHSTQHEHIQPKDSPSLTVASSLDDVVQKYLNDLLDRDFHSDIAYGVRKLLNGYKFGNEFINFTTDKINIGASQYDKTAGLIELLFRKNPNENLIGTSDIDTYREIARNTNLLRKDFKPNTSFKNPKYNTKFHKYLSILLPSVIQVDNKIQVDQVFLNL